MLALTQRHAREITLQARDDLSALADTEREKADEFLNIVQEIYVKAGDQGFFNAESRIVDIIAKYGEQEKKKLSSSYEKDRMLFPVDDSAWEESMAAAQRPSTSRPRRPRSGQRSTGPGNKRRREASTSSSGPSAPPPPPTQAQVSQGQPQQQAGGSKGKASNNSRVKGNSRRPDLLEAPPAPNPGPAPRDHQSFRGSRGGNSSRGQGRGRGGRGQNPRSEAAAFSSEDRAMFEEMKRHFQSRK